jgi:hypothetical protein
MESTKEPVVHLTHNHGNVFDKIHTMPIQSKDAGERILLRIWKRYRAIEHTQQRVKIADFTEVAEATELGKRHVFTTMAPPKQGEPIQRTRQPQVKTRAQTQSQESEQQPSPPPEVINVDEIPSPDTTMGSPTHIEEETQQIAPTGMDIDMSEEGKG